MKAYKMTGESKIEGVCDFVENLVDNGAKFLIFAHHLCMLDALEKFAIKSKFGYIRIDGRVPSERRHEYVK
jgi:SNF2 family DNA or RNA helicase